MGHHLEHPLLIAPMGAHMFVHPEGEVIAAAGAEKAGALYESSGASNRSLEDIAKASKGPKWFQLYFNADAGVTRSLLERAKRQAIQPLLSQRMRLVPGQVMLFQHELAFLQERRSVIMTPLRWQR